MYLVFHPTIPFRFEHMHLSMKLLHAPADQLDDVLGLNAADLPHEQGEVDPWILTTGKQLLIGVGDPQLGKKFAFLKQRSLPLPFFLLHLSG